MARAERLTDLREQYRTRVQTVTRGIANQVAEVARELDRVEDPGARPERLEERAIGGERDRATADRRGEPADGRRFTVPVAVVVLGRRPGGLDRHFSRARWPPDARVHEVAPLPEPVPDDRALGADDDPFDEVARIHSRRRTPRAPGRSYFAAT